MQDTKFAVVCEPNDKETVLLFDCCRHLNEFSTISRAKFKTTLCYLRIFSHSFLAPNESILVYKILPYFTCANILEFFLLFSKYRNRSYMVKETR